MHYPGRNTLLNSPAATLSAVHLKHTIQNYGTHEMHYARFPPLLAQDSEAPAGVWVIVLVTLQQG